MTIKIGIMGYGNLGRGVELALQQNPDMELRAILTRRDPASLVPLTPHVSVYSAQQAPELGRQAGCPHHMRRQRYRFATPDP